MSRISYQACPICESKNIRFERKALCTSHSLYKNALPAEMHWHRCGECGHGFTSGYFTDESLKILFSDTHSFQMAGYSIEQNRSKSAAIVDKITRYLDILEDVKDWLDVGFGDGSLIYTASEFGFNAVGVDLRRDNVKKLQEDGFEAICCAIEELSRSRKFSVISMADVLEHTPFPAQTLKSVREILRPGGLLFLSMPNEDCQAWKSLDTAGSNPYWSELEHYHNFSRDRLYSLLRKLNFAPLHYGISERYRLGMEVIARAAP